SWHTISLRDWSSDVFSTDLRIKPRAFFCFVKPDTSARFHKAKVCARLDPRAIMPVEPEQLMFSRRHDDVHSRCHPRSRALLFAQIGRASCRESMLIDVVMRL